jgi:hypothetical protein
MAAEGAESAENAKRAGKRRVYPLKVLLRKLRKMEMKP